jgi:hypothetical protein
VPVAVRLQLVELRTDLGIGRNVGGAVDLGGDGLHLVPQRLILVVDEAEVRFAALDDLDDLAGDVGRAGAALGPMAREHQRHVERRHRLGEQRMFRGRVGGEVIDRDHARQAVVVAHVVDVALQIRDALFERREVFRVDLLQIGAAVKFERADRSRRSPPPRAAARTCGT